MTTASSKQVRHFLLHHSIYCFFYLKASQCWCLGRLLPLIIGNSIPTDDAHWSNFLLLLHIIDYIFAPVISLNTVDYLEVLINEHHTAFTKLYKDCNIIPKMHYMVHYSDWIRKYVPIM